MRSALRDIDIRAAFVEFARTRDPGLRSQLVEAHRGLAHYLARRFSNRGEPHDDLVQVGSLALIKAVDRFDPERGIEFTTFATHTVLGELKRHFRDRGWTMRMPRRLQELYLWLGQLAPELSQQLGRSPTVRELADAAGVGEEDVLEAMEAGRGYRAASLDAPIAEETDGLMGQLGSEDTGFAEADTRAVVSPLIAELPERERAILVMRFFEGKTQAEIASHIGISQMHVSRLLSRTLEQLRRAASPR